MLKCILHTDEYLDFKDDKSPKTKSRKERGMHETSDLNLSLIFINMFQRIYGKKYNMTRELANYFSNSNLNTVWFLIGSQISHISDAFEMCLSLTTVTRRVMGEVWNGFILLNKSYQFRHVTHFHTHPKRHTMYVQLLQCVFNIKMRILKKYSSMKTLLGYNIMFITN